jgi:hypothetical protein
VIRAIARFFFWYHLKATLWTSGIIVLIAALNQLGLVSTLQSFFTIGGQTYQAISTILGPIGLLAVFVFAISFLLNRRRKLDGPTDDWTVNH